MKIIDEYLNRLYKDDDSKDAERLERGDKGTFDYFCKRVYESRIFSR